MNDDITERFDREAAKLGWKKTVTDEEKLAEALRVSIEHKEREGLGE